MDEVNQALTYGDVVLFKCNSNNQNGFVSEALRILNFYKIKKPIRFSYIPSSGELLKALTLKENILLESIPTSLCRSKEFQLKNYLQKTGNINLVRLFNLISDHLEKRVDELPEEIIKLSIFVKGIIQESPIMILDQPEKHLSPDSLKLIERTLRHNILEQKQLIIVKSKKSELLGTYITKIVTKDNSIYKLSTLTPKSLKKTISTQTIYDASRTGVLKFKNLPSDIKKRSA
jgi:ABC-type lipoprotein export system ATPase subunit